MYNDAMSKSITVRDVPDETSEKLASRAAATGRSLQEYLRARLIELADSPDADALLAVIRERKSTTHSHATVDQILGHRNAERR
jgi:plasmid stability protein